MGSATKTGIFRLVRSCLASRAIARVAPTRDGGPNADGHELIGSPDPLYRSTFVGREPELRQLQAAFDAAISLPSEWLDKAKAKIGTAPKRQNRQAALEERKRRIGRAYADGAYTDAEYRKEMQALDGELAAIEAEPKPADANVDLLRDLETLWLAANLEERHTLLRSMVDRIYIEHEGGRIVAVAPKAAMVPIFAALATKPETGVTIEPSVDDDMVVWWRRGRIELPVQTKTVSDLLQA